MFSRLYIWLNQYSIVNIFYIHDYGAVFFCPEAYSRYDISAQFSSHVVQKKGDEISIIPSCLSFPCSWRNQVPCLQLDWQQSCQHRSEPPPLPWEMNALTALLINKMSTWTEFYKSFLWTNHLYFMFSSTHSCSNSQCLQWRHPTTILWEENCKT